MSKKLFKVPFTYTLTAVALVVAETAEEARDHVSDNHVFDETNIDESNVFWEEGAMILKSDCRDGDPQVAEATEVTEPSEIVDLCSMYDINLNVEDESDDEDDITSDDNIDQGDDGLPDDEGSDELDSESRNRRDLEHG